jgi:hypothetical protein
MSIQLEEAIFDLLPNAKFSIIGYDYSGIQWSDERPKPTEEEIQTKIAELNAAEPLRLLRIERDRLLQQTDWEIQRNTERNIDSTELITYRNALRDLPQEIESGNISAPTLDDQGNLIFDNWPERNLVNGEPS